MGTLERTLIGADHVLPVASPAQETVITTGNQFRSILEEQTIGVLVCIPMG